MFWLEDLTGINYLVSRLDANNIKMDVKEIE